MVDGMRVLGTGEMFVLQKNGSRTDASTLCKDADKRLCVWYSEQAACEYREHGKPLDYWVVRSAASTDFKIFGSMKAHKNNQTRPCYLVMDKENAMSKNATSSGCLVEIYENYENRKFAIASRAEHEEEFLVEVSQVLAATPSSDWNVRLREVLPLVVDMCCKYRGYKADSVVERRELVAGDLEMPSLS